MGRLEQGPYTSVRKVEEGLAQQLGVGQASGRGMVVEGAGIPRRAVGCGQWREEELAGVVLAWQGPEVPCGGRGGGGCGWCGGSAGVGVGVERSSRLGRLVHTLEQCSCIHKGWRLSFL